MSDKALSMSLDDYIKTQKKGNSKQQQQPGNRARGKGSGPQVNVARNLSNKHKTRYFQSGVGGGAAGRIRGGNSNAKATSRTAVNGRKNGGRLSRPTLGGSRNGNLNNNAGKRASGLQFKRINNRLNVGGRIRPRISQRTNRLQTSLPNPRLNQRAQRFGTSGNRNQNPNQVQALVSTRNSNQGGLISAGNRNRNQQNRKNWTRGLNRNNRVLPGGSVRPRNSNSNSLTMIKPKPNIRVRNKRVQQLIQKRIQRARVTLARKTVNRNNLRIAPALLTSRRAGGPRLGSLIAGNPRIRISKAQRALAQQKLNRARQARARSAKTQRQGGDGPSRRQRQNNRGLILDRNNLVKVRVANDFRSRNLQPSFHPSVYQHQHQQPTSSSSFASGPYPLMSVSHGYPEHGADSDMAMGYDFPPFVLSNNLSRDRDHHAMAMESARQSLNPDIQRKISIIQNRAKHSRNQLEILPDFKGPVSTCKVNPGDRFRMMMN